LAKNNDSFNILFFNLIKFWLVKFRIIALKGHKQQHRATPYEEMQSEIEALVRA
jgi:hypothetical protein